MSASARKAGPATPAWVPLSSLYESKDGRPAFAERDYCLEHKCVNGACKNGEFGYTCECYAEFAGEFCNRKDSELARTRLESSEGPI